MTEDLTKRRAVNRSRINVNEDYEVRYWTAKFGISAAALKVAVKTVGVSAAAVDKYLKGK